MSLRVTINGEERRFDAPVSVNVLLEQIGLEASKIAVERNLEIVPRSKYQDVLVADGDRLEIVQFIGGGNAPIEQPSPDKPFTIAGKTYRSRLIIGTGKYKSYEQNARALEASGAEIVTVAVRRVNLTDPSQPKLVDFIDPKTVTYLPNTAGCFTGEDAVRTLRLAREAGGWSLVKLEVLGDKKTLYPDMLETLRAAEMLVDDGFQVMVYCNDDPMMAKRLENLGAAAIMPLASPIGSGLGIQSPINIRLIIEEAKVPVIVDAGIGTASDAAVAMELGCDGVISEHGDRGSERSCADGARDETWCGGGTPRLSRRPHGEEALRRSLKPSRWLDLSRRAGRWAAAFLFVASAARAEGAPDIARLLDRTVWVDIGLGRTLVSISAKQIADLRRCKEPTMSFQKRKAGWVQTFYPGMAMTTTYNSAALAENDTATTISFFTSGKRAPTETVHLSKAADVLVQETPGFRPHTFVRCELPPSPSPDAGTTR